jgi:hypothetical protein
MDAGWGRERVAAEACRLRPQSFSSPADLAAASIAW